ncbi:hypothetical protein QBC37DRAFT_76789 [Rhypophila decipiens]|uniref:Mid2 domain-containing protein n=1 Tax=Rhypophila decipiens TaxID=261697 RepID=A0AAN7BBS9_9PEZI|nr:hypothetical protein QBC37DRAFT_76789 [Rhypophila decipiens]
MTTFKIQTRQLAASLIVLTAYLSTTIRAVENAPCYYPGGEPALGFYPCQAFDAAISSCCPAGWTCFSNALCIATTNSNSFPNLTLGAVQRGACTNPKWTNDICGGACLDPENADGKLAACGDDRFCCSNDFNTGKCNCEGGEGSEKVVTISAGLPQTIIQVDDTTFVGAPSISIASTRTSLPPTRSTDSRSSETSSTSTSGQGPSATTSTPTSTATGSSSQSGGEDGGGSSNKGKIIGIAVGASVGGALVLGLILGYVCWYRPRHPSTGGVAAAQNVPPGPFSDMAPAEDHANGPSFGQQYNTSGYGQGGI